MVPDELQSEPLLSIPFATVVSPSHPLASTRGVASASAITKHVQLVLSDRTVLSEGRNFGVLSPLTWRLADLGAKHAFLKAGLGWGHMPLHMVKADLDSGAFGQDPGRRFAARHGPSNEGGLSQGHTAGARGSGLHCATQAEVGNSPPTWGTVVERVIHGPRHLPAETQAVVLPAFALSRTGNFHPGRTKWHVYPFGMRSR